MRLTTSRTLHRLRRLSLVGERGATAVITIVLLVPVLFGAAAISVDVGNILWERRQLQNGADATVLAAAQKCADATTCNPSTAAGGTLATVADANANDGANTISSICGNAAARAVSTTLSLCSVPATPGVTDCPTVPSAVASTVPYLEVRTTTKTSTGSSSLSNRFARMLTGGQATSTVTACARAAWTGVGPTNLNVLPIVMSYCDWQSATGYNGTAGSATYPASPDYSLSSTGYTGTGGTNPWSSSWERTVYTKNNPSTCPTWNGHTAPGGFSALDTNSSCTVTSSLDAWYHGNTGNDAPCPTANFSGLQGTVVYLPVFDCLTNSPTTVITSATNCNSGNGNNTYYHVSGYAAFYLTGWYFSNNQVASIATGSVPCTGGDRCMSGWFLKDLVTAADLSSLTNPTPGAPNYGLVGAVPLG